MFSPNKLAGGPRTAQTLVADAPTAHGPARGLVAAQQKDRHGKLARR